MATIYKKVGTRIRELRKYKGLTQEQLADKANMDPKSVIQIEAGNRNPTLKTIHKIAGVLGVTPKELLS